MLEEMERRDDLPPYAKDLASAVRVLERIQGDESDARMDLARRIETIEKRLAETEPDGARTYIPRIDQVGDLNNMTNAELADWMRENIFLDPRFDKSMNTLLSVVTVRLERARDSLPGHVKLAPERDRLQERCVKLEKQLSDVLRTLRHLYHALDATKVSDVVRKIEKLLFVEDSDD